jgi:Transglutaminase-like superfamily
MTVFQIFRVRSAADWMLLAEAASLYVFVAAALRILSYPRMQRALEQLARLRRHPHGSLSDVTWAITAVGKRIGGATCLAEAAVAYTMLRRRGHEPHLRLGVRRGGSALEAHAWIECGGAVVFGEVAEMTGYAVLR